MCNILNQPDHRVPPLAIQQLFGRAFYTLQYVGAFFFCSADEHSTFLPTRINDKTYFAAFRQMTVHFVASSLLPIDQ